MRRGRLSLALLLLLAARPAGAAPTDSQDRNGDPEKHPARAALEALALISANATWYWLHTSMNVEDWELRWDWPAWNTKLSSFDYVLFDTNPWSVNAVTHPVAGLLYYQVGRANGYGMVGATVLDFGTAVLWEYLAEFKEKIALNDIIINTAAGFGGAEALVQVGRYFRSLRPTWLNQTMAFLFTPFESLHPPARDMAGVPWHRFELTGGIGSTSFDGHDGFAEQVAALDLRLVAHRGYGEPGERAGPTAAGAWTRVLVRLAFGRDEPSSGLPGVRVASETTFLGRYAQRIGDDDRGTGLFTGLGGGFLYETRRLERDEDRLLIAHLAGPRLELGAYSSSVVLRWDLAAYLDFALVQAQVFGPDLPFDPSPPFTTPLRRFGYYYAFGATAAMRAELAARSWHLELEVWGHAFLSIDGRDRIEMQGAPEDPHGITDQRLFGRCELAAYPWSRAVGLAFVVDGALRRGSWERETRETTELRPGFQMSVRF